jgi:hypothetical protein
VGKAFCNIRSICTVGIVSLFVLFLTASTPHRVHHFFEKVSLPKAENHSHAHHHHAADKGHDHGDDRESPPPQQSDCAMQSAAQNGHLASVQFIEVPFLQISLARNPDRGVIATKSFNPSPFSQRAPPAA